MKNSYIEIVRRILKELVMESNEETEIILIGDLPLQLYGMEYRSTVDIYTKVRKSFNSIEEISKDKNAKKIPWSFYLTMKLIGKIIKI